MRSALRLLCSIVLLLAATGCGSVDAVNGPAGNPGVAATVNGVDIPLSEVEERIASLRRNPEIAQRLESDPDGALLGQAQTDVLNQLVQTELLSQGAEEEFGIEIGQAVIDEQEARLIEEVGGQEAFDDLVEQNGLTDEQVEAELRRVALTEAITERLTEDNDVTDEEVEQFYEENRETRYGPTATARHILTEDEATAQSAIDRINAGEEFAEVASALSTDPGSAERGGDLGELAPGQTVPEFDDAVFSAPIGELVGPIETQFGFHVIEVTQREDEGQSLESVEGEIREELSASGGQERFQEFLLAQAEDAEVTVNPRFGEWDPETGAVVQADPLGEVETPAPEGAAPEGAAPEGAAPEGAAPEGAGEATAPPGDGDQ